MEAESTLRFLLPKATFDRLVAIFGSTMRVFEGTAVSSGVCLKNSCIAFLALTELLEASRSEVNVNGLSKTCVLKLLDALELHPMIVAFSVLKWAGTHSLPEGPSFRNE
ncbi:unnamed protein product [Toxocara canis]|uniref:BTB/POZ domain-containing protein n=1 Tax=Toxocara canis TaxID=6265 RepID=A0A183TWD7_TOXCA|nr:unnamed protein product [Toxocara canis]